MHLAVVIPNNNQEESLSAFLTLDQANAFRITTPLMAGYAFFMVAEAIFLNTAIGQLALDNKVLVENHGRSMYLIATSVSQMRRYHLEQQWFHSITRLQV